MSVFNKAMVVVKFYVDTYGVDSCLNDGEGPSMDNLWFACPECGEPILLEDWGSEFFSGICPICDENIGDVD